MEWNMQDLLAYFETWETWSSSVKYRQANHVGPTTLIESDLARAWGDPQQKRDLRFPLYMRLGRVQIRLQLSASYSWLTAESR
jgi:hypothetical protein